MSISQLHEPLIFAALFSFVFQIRAIYQTSVAIEFGKAERSREIQSWEDGKIWASFKFRKKNRIFIWEVIMETEELTRLVDEIYKVSDQFFRSDELIISSNEFN